ncbi:MAG: hypothetical protein IJU29_08485 [Oscillospiraceae bacterium]|nr:hypothetical protein [Oscillospiraceae bacterium]
MKKNVHVPSGGQARKLTDGEEALLLQPDGAQEPAPEEPAADAAAENRDALPGGEELSPDEREALRKRDFAALIGGEYRDLYQEALRQAREPWEQEKMGRERFIRGWMPVLQSLFERYGSDDPQVVDRRLREDRDFWDAEGRRQGVAPEVLRYIRRMERENRDLRDRDRRLELERQDRDRRDGWRRQAEKLRERYPDFDLEKETEDRDFLALLLGGVPVELAYRAMHLDDLIGQAERRASKQAEDRVADAVRARGSRPRAAGAGQTGAFTLRGDVSRLTKAQRADIAKRVMQGETISF